MGESIPENKESYWVGGIVSAIGLLLTGIHFIHGLREVSEEPTAIIYGVVVPLLVSLSVVVSGYWLAKRERHNVSYWRIIKWIGGGMATLMFWVFLLVQSQTAHGVTIDDVGFVLGMGATYGAAIGLLLGIYDIRINETTAEWKEKAQRLDEFAGIVSHDLRNPLNIAQGHVQMAEETGDLTHLEKADDAHHRMQAIISETLTLARQGEEALSLTPISLADTATQVWELIDTDDSELVVETDENIVADRNRLRALLENLFANAIQHNETPIEITVGMLDEDGFYVEDNGQGIPSELRERVFEGGFSTDGQSTGLGLAIVRAAVEAHDWSMQLTESNTGGARFEIRNVQVTENK